MVQEERPVILQIYDLCILMALVLTKILSLSIEKNRLNNKNISERTNTNNISYCSIV